MFLKPLASTKFSAIWTSCARCYASSVNGDILALKNRGIFQNVFPAENESKAKSALTSSSQTIYAGFDPTADSLHVGNLLVIIGLLHCQRAGHQPIALVGGATGRIGDPSGRTTKRPELQRGALDNNLTQIKRQINGIFKNHALLFWKDDSLKTTLKPIRVVDNADWYESFNIIDFIANVGRHFRMGTMLSRSSVQTRLQSETGMSFTEFTYQMFQAYDWLYLFKNYDCRFQIGGNDQMGNVMSGHELIGRVENKSVYAITLPIITNEAGDKFGKSAGNAVWLDAKKTSPFAFYQFFMRTTDGEVENLLKLLTFLPLDEIAEIMARHKKTPEIRDAQTKLAQEVTLLVHGAAGVEKAETISSALYQGNFEALGDLNPKDVSQTFNGAPTCELLLEPGMTMLDVAMKAKCFVTERDAARIIAAGGFYVNQKRTTNLSEVLVPGVHIMKNNLSLFRVGKKNYTIVQWLS